MRVHCTITYAYDIIQERLVVLTRVIAHNRILELKSLKNGYSYMYLDNYNLYTVAQTDKVHDWCNAMTPKHVEIR